jgi:hypothetical protein
VLEIGRFFANLSFGAHVESNFFSQHDSPVDSVQANDPGFSGRVKGKALWRRVLGSVALDFNIQACAVQWNSLPSLSLKRRRFRQIAVNQ